MAERALDELLDKAIDGILTGAPDVASGDELGRPGTHRRRPARHAEREFSVPLKS